MAIKEKVNKIDGVHVDPISIKVITFNILGVTPLIMNRQSEKVKHMLLLPPQASNKAARSQTLKHEPMEEFRASPYLSKNDPGAPTWLHMPTGAFKRCLATAALDTPGATKAQIGRLVSMASEKIHIWGIPMIRADVVRQAGINRTPDIRFRACLREWATTVSFSYVERAISHVSIANLMNAAGTTCGVGDFRVEKGAGDYGKFAIVGEDMEDQSKWNDWKRIVANGGRDIQMAAMENPLFYDDEAEEMVHWFYEELERRRGQPQEARAAGNGSAGEDFLPPEDGSEFGEGDGLELPQ